MADKKDTKRRFQHLRDARKKAAISSSLAAQRENKQNSDNNYLSDLSVNVDSVNAGQFSDTNWPTDNSNTDFSATNQASDKMPFSSNGPSNSVQSNNFLPVGQAAQASFPENIKSSPLPSTSKYTDKKLKLDVFDKLTTLKSVFGGRNDEEIFDIFTNYYYQKAAGLPAANIGRNDELTKDEVEYLAHRTRIIAQEQGLEFPDEDINFREYQTAKLGTDFLEKLEEYREEINLYGFKTTNEQFFWHLKLKDERLVAQNQNNHQEDDISASTELPSVENDLEKEEAINTTDLSPENADTIGVSADDEGGTESTKEETKFEDITDDDQNFEEYPQEIAVQEDNFIKNELNASPSPDEQMQTNEWEPNSGRQYLEGLKTNLTKEDDFSAQDGTFQDNNAASIGENDISFSSMSENLANKINTGNTQTGNYYEDDEKEEDGSGLSNEKKGKKSTKEKIKDRAKKEARKKLEDKLNPSKRATRKAARKAGEEAAKKAAEEAGKEISKKAIKKAGKRAAKEAGRSTGRKTADAARKAAAKAAKKAAKAMAEAAKAIIRTLIKAAEAAAKALAPLLVNPYFWVGVGVVLLIAAIAAIIAFTIILLRAFLADINSSTENALINDYLNSSCLDAKLTVNPNKIDNGGSNTASYNLSLGKRSNCISVKINDVKLNREFSCKNGDNCQPNDENTSDLIGEIDSTAVNDIEFIDSANIAPIIDEGVLGQLKGLELKDSRQDFSWTGKILPTDGENITSYSDFLMTQKVIFDIEEEKDPTIVSNSADSQQCIKGKLGDLFEMNLFDTTRFMLFLGNLMANPENTGEILAKGRWPDCGSSNMIGGGNYNVNWKPFSSADYESQKTAIKAACINDKNMSAYRAGSAATGVPWELLAAVHYREGSCKSSKSLISGREIGDPEPDNGYKTYSSLEETAVVAAKELLSKNSNLLIGLNDGKLNTDSALKELILATSRYNGGGNRNCGNINSSLLSPSLCPPKFKNGDDPYAMNLFDGNHDKMYIIYCKDHVKCNPPVLDTRPGVVTIYKMLSE